MEYFFQRWLLNLANFGLKEQNHLLKSFDEQFMEICVYYVIYTPYPQLNSNSVDEFWSIYM